MCIYINIHIIIILLKGIICNCIKIKFLSLWASNHWYAIRKIKEIEEGAIYNLDSELHAPFKFENLNDGIFF